MENKRVVENANYCWVNWRLGSYGKKVFSFRGLEIEWEDKMAHLLVKMMKLLRLLHYAQWVNTAAGNKNYGD